MAFDRNLVPKDLRPLNIPRTLPEDPNVSAAATATTNTATTARKTEFFSNPDVSVPVFYPATVSDAGFVGLGYGNPPPGVAPWVQVMPAPVGNVNVGPPTGFGYSVNLASRVVGNAVDRASGDTAVGYGCTPNFGSWVNADGSNELASVGSGGNSGLGNQGSSSGVDLGSEEGGNDSVSGKRIKFLCSFGGKILPRPSDAALRYVGGQTRIISVRRDVSFNEFVQKMADTYRQPVVIKYQLPDEDLDALVSVSCPDDLDNMMEEYEKLLERSSDGSAKLRVFLFSASEIDSSGVVQFGDFHDSGQRYVDAVNGIADGLGGGISRKESIASATSTQNSDFSGNEAVDSAGPGQGDVTVPPSGNMLSPGGNSATANDGNPKLVQADCNTPIYTDESGVQLGMSVAVSGPPRNLPSQPEVEFERSVPVITSQQQFRNDFQQVGMGIPASATQLQAFTDPRQQNVNHTDYMHPSHQMGFPNGQLLGTAGSIFNQQQICNSNSSVAPQQFIPAMHTSMTPSSSHVAMSSTIIQPLLQRQHRYPEENAYGSRMVQLPVNPGYNGYQAEIPSAVVGGYGWHQVPQAEHFVFSSGSLSHQQVIFPEKISRLEDCYMCQTALPHAHSDPLPQDQREGVNPESYATPVNHNLRLEDAMRGQPVSRLMVSGTLGEGTVEQGAGTQPAVPGHVDHQVGTPHSQAIVFPQNLEAPQDNERLALLKTGNYAATLGMVALPGDIQPPYGMLTGAMPQSHLEDSVQQHSVPIQYQVKHEPLLNKPVVNNVSFVASVPVQASEHTVHDSPKEYSGKPPRVGSKEDMVASGMPYDQLRPIDGMLETLQVSPSEINGNRNVPPVDVVRKDEIIDHGTCQIAGRELFLNHIPNKPQVFLDSSHVKQAEALSVSTEASPVHNSRPMGLYEDSKPSILGNLESYSQSKTGMQLLDSGEASYKIPGFSGLESGHAIDKIPEVVEWKNNALQLQPKGVHTDVEAVSSNVSILPTSGPSSRVAQDFSNSVFSSQDPWNSRHDTHFPPPRPNKIPMRKEAFTTQDSFSGNHLGNELKLDVLLEDVLSPSNSHQDFSSEHGQSSKGSAEDLIKQELKTVAEGVAATVLKSATSNPDSLVHEGNDSSIEENKDKEVSNRRVEMQHKDRFEDIKSKLPEKVNFGFPVSQDIGRLQIIKNSDLEELRELGSGTFGTVYHGKWRGTDVAIKRINDRCFAGKPSEQDRMINDFWNEAVKLADMHHPNVVAFYGVVLDGPGRSVATVTEYMVNGSLRNALQKNERNLEKRKRLMIAMDVAFGMEYLHGKNIVHFDLKSDNLLVNLRDPHRPICKVGDLGLSKVKRQTLISGGVRGTLPWMAPELLNGSSSLVSEKVDVFSFGIVMWELLTGAEPYADLHYGAIIGGIVSNTLRPPVPESCDPEWRSLMERCWSAEPSERPNFSEIANELRAMGAKVSPKGQNASPQLAST